MICRFQVEGAGEWDPEHEISFENELGSFRISSGILTVVPKGEAVLGDEGQLELFLRAWELESALRPSSPLIRFRTRETPKPDPMDLREDHTEESLVIVVKYPHPPAIRFIPELALAWERFDRARLGFGESLQSAAYYILSVVEARAGGRAAAAHRFRIDEGVLRKLGELTSAWTSESPRKAVVEGAPRLERAHELWIEAAVRGVLLWVCAEAAGRDWEVLSFGDLPSV